ncbi:nucleoside diphosphate kinase 6 isoform X2 [Wyeomyia smithii]|uniref:nucleoside diphosphate kinase 6 isoform X2 n=1 Tax=Wyeomyia smithii TaxID=174621 RepID=UPI002467E086|nr:nucleoside diphosphate kinase 6 isoform X2 [Wyeomyia smithii]
MGAAGGFTLAIFKPHLLRNPVAYAAAQQLIESSGLRVVTSRRLQLTESEARRFYREHEGRFFHRRLISLMTSGPLEVLVLSGENAIAKWRELLGPTKVYKAVYSHPDCLRSMYGISDTRNAGHGSDPNFDRPGSPIRHRRRCVLRCHKIAVTTNKEPVLMHTA